MLGLAIGVGIGSNLGMETSLCYLPELIPRMKSSLWREIEEIIDSGD